MEDPVCHDKSSDSPKDDREPLKDIRGKGLEKNMSKYVLLKNHSNGCMILG